MLQGLKEGLGLPGEVFPRVGTAFGAGVGRSGGPCGSVAGVLVGIGVLLGRDGPEDGKERAYEEARRFTAAFEERFGSTSCPAILGFDLSRPGESARAREAAVLESRCAATVAFGADFLEDLLRRLAP